MNQFSRNLILWAIISLLMVVLFNMFNQPQGTQARLTYTEFLQKVERGEVLRVTIQGQKLTGESSEGKAFQTYAPHDPELVSRLISQKVEVKAEPQEEAPWYMTLLVSWFPMLLLIGVWIFFMRQMQGGGGKAMSFGRSRARMITPESARVTFEDVAGVDEAKEELSEVVEFLSNPRKFTRLGGRIPKGVLLVGPPGTGKTLLARAVAGEAGVPFFSISGSDFVEMFVGVGASRVRDLFMQGKKNAPCLIFIDEIDAVGRQRGGDGRLRIQRGRHPHRRHQPSRRAGPGAAAPRPLRPPGGGAHPRRARPQAHPGSAHPPHAPGHRRGTGHHRQGHARLLGRGPGEPGQRGRPASRQGGQGHENLVNEAALQAAKVGKDTVDMGDFEYAKDKVLMGKERRSLILSDEEKRITAYHEAGHALAAKLLPGSDPVHKVTIIPRGRALGVTMQLPEGDRHGYSRSFLLNNLALLLGGRVAEEVVFNDITTGAGNDIERATKMARKMVCEWGMSDAIGPLNIGEQGEEVFIGREWAHSRNFSEETARLVDAEVKRIIDEARQRCRALLEENIDSLHAIAGALLERETISGDDIDILMRGEPLPPEKPNNRPGTARAGEQSASGRSGVASSTAAAQAGPAQAAPTGADADAAGRDEFTLEADDTSERGGDDSNGGAGHR